MVGWFVGAGGVGSGVFFGSFRRRELLFAGVSFPFSFLSGLLLQVHSAISSTEQRPEPSEHQPSFESGDAFGLAVG